MPTSFLAKCPCGAVTLQIAGAALGQVYCHCDDCQNAHGAAYVPRSIHHKKDVVVVAGNTTVWTNVTRNMVMCSSCGSHLYSEHEMSPFRGVNAGNFPAERFRPSMHLYCKFAVAGVTDKLVHYLDTPEEFGGTGELVDW